MLCERDLVCRQALVPANVVSPAGVQRRQTVRLLLGFVGAGGHDRLPASLGAGRVDTGAEEQLVGVLGRHPVEELPQRLVALGAVAGVGPGAPADAGGNVLGPQPLAQLVHVTGLGGIQAAVDLRDLILGACGRERHHGGLWHAAEGTLEVIQSNPNSPCSRAGIAVKKKTRPGYGFNLSWDNLHFLSGDVSPTFSRNLTTCHWDLRFCDSPVKTSVPTGVCVRLSQMSKGKFGQSQAPFFVVVAVSLETLWV